MKIAKQSFFILLILPPFFFLLTLFALSIYLSSKGIRSAEEISTEIAGHVPLILLISQGLMLSMLLLYAKKQHRNPFRETFQSDKLKSDVLFGSILGMAMAFLYEYGLHDLIVFLQKSLGDYIPPAELGPSLKSNLFAFGLANILLAPFVEENIYRNFGFSPMVKTFGKWQAILYTSFFFGLLHWMGGVWYILTTFLFVGIPLAWLRLKKNSLFFAFIAHLSLNTIEFLNSMLPIQKDW